MLTVNHNVNILDSRKLWLNIPLTQNKVFHCKPKLVDFNPCQFVDSHDKMFISKLLKRFFIVKKTFIFFVNTGNSYVMSM